ncbi:chromosome partitioning protein [Aneurinibacillus soli]|uniref:Sporulation initiation inhibitor protein Soj n=1 Tax=Aneurinibacillus soli TaxID=1500254 RepID=A0A0U5ARF6_9BACL|nr:ParA family protein [Aneurinibacillus soli]PYE60122.1 chromosome partitioning protein [Aneurinibacillus soli]BAU26389.1 Sporulation initiation inhibitor protein Soj [Aneurinibacillus soli]
MTIISLYNNKGGVAKTTTAITTASCLVQLGKRVLLLDLDPQANASDAAGIGEEGNVSLLLELLLTSRGSDPFSMGQVDGLRRPSSIIGCDVIPASPALDQFAEQAAQGTNREFRLQTILAPLRSSYDYILIDCPPSLSLLTMNALAASDYVVIPCDSSKYALTGMSNLITKYNKIRESCNQTLEIAGILNTKVEMRAQTSRLSREKLADYFGDLLFTSYIPKSASVEKSQYAGETLLTYDRHSPALAAYQSFTKELIQRVSTKKNQ